MTPGSNVSTNTYNVKIGSTAYIYQFQSAQNIGGTVTIYSCSPQAPPAINSAQTFNLRYVGAGLISLGILVVICAFAMAALVSQSPTAATLAGGYDALQFI